MFLPLNLFFSSSCRTFLLFRILFLLFSSPLLSKNMPIQRRTINIGSVLGTLAPEPSETSNVPLAPGFSEGESVMKKRKKGEEEAEAVKEQQGLIQAEPSVTKSSSKKGKGKDSRTPQKAAGHVSHKRKHQKELPAPWKCEFYVDGRPVNEDDSVWKSKDVRGGQIADAVGSALLLPKDMKSWKGSNSTQMIENLKRDSVVVSFILYFLFYYNNLSFSLFILTIISRLSKGFLKPDIG
jgi:hypothetical protein